MAQQAIADLEQAQLSAKEVDIFLQAVTDLDTLSCAYNPLRTKKIPLSYSWSEITKRWQKRLQTRVPLQYLLESVVWRNFTLKVSPGVLFLVRNRVINRYCWKNRQRRRRGNLGRSGNQVAVRSLLV
jgi:methylase of polypeptide subunit release factors